MADIELDDFYKPPDMVGELLRYDFLDRLGQGSFGITWLALDKNLNRNVAIKQFHPGSGHKLAAMDLTTLRLMLRSGIHKVSTAFSPKRDY